MYHSETSHVSNLAHSGLTPSPDLDSKARKHDYVMLLPDTTVTESSGRKKPPPVPRPYHETHYYMNIPKPQR